MIRACDAKLAKTVRNVPVNLGLFTMSVHGAFIYERTRAKAKHVEQEKVRSEDVREVTSNNEKEMEMDSNTTSEARCIGES